ncbi:MAG: hypothetical protein ACRBF0_16565 [Calditrichia bacterium]
MFGSCLRYLILSVIIMFFVSSCSLFDSSEDSVDARIVINRLAIENNTGEPIYYFAVGEITSQLIDWAPSVLDENKIRPGEKVLLMFEELHLAEEDKKVFVYWWNGIEVTGEETNGEIHTLIVKIK